MEGSDLDVLGPVDYLVVEFPAAKANFSGEMATQLDRSSTASSSVSWICSCCARTWTDRSRLPS